MSGVVYKYSPHIWCDLIELLTTALFSVDLLVFVFWKWMDKFSPANNDENTIGLLFVHHLLTLF